MKYCRVNNVGFLLKNSNLFEKIGPILKKSNIIVNNFLSVFEIEEYIVRDEGSLAVIVIEYTTIYADSLKKIVKLSNSLNFIEIILVTHNDEDQNKYIDLSPFHSIVNYNDINQILIIINSAFEKSLFRRREYWFSELQNLSVKLNSIKEYQKIFNLTCEAAVKMCNADHSGIVLFDNVMEGYTIAEYPINKSKSLRTKIKVKGSKAEEELINKGKTICIKDVRNTEHLGGVKDTLLDYGIKSILIVPVSLFERVIASISVDMIKKERCFFDDEIEILKTLAHLVGASLRNLFDFEKIQALQEIGNILTSSFHLTVEEIIELIYKNISKIIDAPNFYVALYNENENKVHFVNVIENYTKLKDLRKEYAPRRTGNGLTEFVIKTKKPLLLNKPTQKWFKENHVKKIGRAEKSWLGAPMIFGSKIYGVIVIQNYELKNAYDEEDKKIISTISNQAALAIHIARTLKMERESRYFAESVNRVTEMFSGIKLSEIANQYLDKIKNIIDYNKATVQIIDEEYRLLIAYKGFIKEDIDERLLRPIKEDKLIKRMMKNSKYLVVPDTSKDIDWEKSPTTLDVESWLCIPLIIQGKIKCLITLDSQRKNHFKSAKENVVKKIIESADELIQSLHLFNEERYKKRDIEIVDDIVKLVNTEVKPQTIYETVVKKLTEYLECSHCTIFLSNQFNSDETILIPTASYGISTTTIFERTFKMGEGLAGWVFKNGITILSYDVEKDPRFIPARFRSDGKISMLVVPIKSGERTIGVISANQNPNRSFTHQNKSLLETLANHIGIALERIGRENSLKLLIDIGNVVITAKKVDEIILEIVNRSKILFNCDETVIHLIGDQDKIYNYSKDINLTHLKIHELHSLLQKIYEIKETVIINDTLEIGYLSNGLKTSFRTIMAIPLIVEGKIHGALIVLYKIITPINTKDLSFLLALTTQAVMAIAKVNMLDAESKRASAFQGLAVLGSLATGIAHQINGPLGGIKASWDYLRNIISQDKEDIIMHIQIINDKYKEIVKTLDNFTSHIKGLNLSLNKVDLSKIINRSRWVIEKKLSEREIEFVNGLNNKEINISADDVSIESVFVSLFDNAIESMDRQGTLKVMLDDSISGYYKINVSDTGHGIPSEKQNDIFKEIYTTKSDTHKGIGLILCYYILKANNSEIKLKSSDCNGTTFSILIPKYKEEIL